MRRFQLPVLQNGCRSSFYFFLFLSSQIFFVKPLYVQNYYFFISVFYKPLKKSYLSKIYPAPLFS